MFTDYQLVSGRLHGILLHFVSTMYQRISGDLENMKIQM